MRTLKKRCANKYKGMRRISRQEQEGATVRDIEVTEQVLFVPRFVEPLLNV